MLTQFAVSATGMGAAISLYVDRRGPAALTVSYQHRIVRMADIDTRKVATPELAEAYLRQEISVPGTDGTLSLVEAFGWLSQRGQLDLLIHGRFPGEITA